MAATSAFAQSTVTISGNVDLGMQTTKTTGVERADYTMNSGDETTRKTKSPVGNGAQGWSSSALNLDVVEDLGNGTKAGYSAGMNLFSWGAGADSANQTLNTGRHSYVFLGNTQMGEVRLGYQYSLDDQIQAGARVGSANVGGRVQNFSIAAQPNISSTTFTAPVVAREGAQNVTSGAVTRVNAIQYGSPVISGFQGFIQTASQYDDTTDAAGTNAAGKATAKLSSAAVKYVNGPLTLGYADTTIKSDASSYASAAGAAETKQKLKNFAATYVLGDATIVYNQFSRKLTMGATLGADYDGSYANNVYGRFDDNGSLKRTGRDLGAKYAIGKTTLFASVGSGKYTPDFAGTGSVDIKIKARQYGVTYSLSKRTSLNAYASSTKAAADGTVLTSDLKKTVTGFGLAHSF